MLHGKFHPRLEEADLAINELRTFNTQKARQEARAILAAGERSAAIAAVLGSLSLAVALMATVMVIRAVRDRARLVEQHGQMLAARATEMEAFAGRVAHDLKTPLGAVALRILATERRGEIPAWLQDDLDKVSGQVRRLDHIIDGLLEFARAGANPPPGARARLQDVLDEVVGEIAPSAAAVDAELRVEPFARMRLACTPGALTSVLCNLLENAVKYISGGRHHPRRIAVRVKDLGQVARVEVEDNGPGLPRGSERLVFEPFQRLSDTRTPGIGLGLATVKRIVEAYRGRIGVHSEPGEGSTFWFELPKAPPEDVPRRDSPDSPASSAHPATPAPPPAPG